MFVREHQNQFRTANADVQMFYAPFTTALQPKLSWNKPPGVSHVYIMLIGAGGNGDGVGSGGGSGAVTVWYGAAQNLPDILFVKVDRGGNQDRTGIYGRFTASAFTELLRANSANSINGGTASNGISAVEAMGFYQSVAGQAGMSGAIAPSTTTFLSGGSPGASGTSTANYGYTTDLTGYFQLQPIIVGIGSYNNTINRPGIGCGGSNVSGTGGDGFALIASW